MSITSHIQTVRQRQRKNEMVKENENENENKIEKSKEAVLSESPT